MQLTDTRFNLSRRSYLVHVPPGCEHSQPLPTVVAIHGAFSTAEKFEKATGLSKLADREGFIAVYPNGIGLFGFLQHWNAGHCCGKAMDDGVDDVGFVAEVIADVRTRLHVDPRRIYMVGNSNGGMLVYRYAAERSEELAAIAVVAGTIGGEASAEAEPYRIPDPERPLATLVFHGRADDRIAYEGGRAEHTRGTRTDIGVEESVSFWVGRNGCRRTPVTEELRQGRVVHDTWGQGQEGTAVELYTINDWGHVWPGRYVTDQLDDGDQMQGFDAAEIIWDFFARHRRDAAPDPRE
jgi:polyhydroxybutyrate depolymerase